MYWMLLLFLITQLFGLFVVYFQPVQNIDSSGLLPLILGLVLGVLLLFLLIKFKLKKIWKFWFFLASLIGITITLEVFIGFFAIPIALFLVYLKMFKSNNYIHNFSEILIYPGIISIIVPFTTFLEVFFLMIFLSIYDMYSVWKSKSMIKFVKFQKETTATFTGLKIKKKNEEQILGGGDIAFPLLFSSVLFLKIGFPALFSVMGSFLGLAILFFISKKGKYYPALPFLTLGLLLGYGLSLLF